MNEKAMYIYIRSMLADCKYNKHTTTDRLVSGFGYRQKWFRLYQHRIRRRVRGVLKEKALRDLTLESI